VHSWYLGCTRRILARGEPPDVEPWRAVGTLFSARRRHNAVYIFDIERFRRGVRAACSSTRPPVSCTPVMMVSRLDGPASTALGDVSRGWGRVGRHRRRPHGGAAVCTLCRTTHGGRLSPDQLCGAAVRQPALITILRTHGRSVRACGRRFRIQSSPIATRRIPRSGAFGTMNPDINSPRVQNWNVTVERAGSAPPGRRGELPWQLLGPAVVADGHQPGLFMGLGPCTLRDGRT